LLNQGVLANL